MDDGGRRIVPDHLRRRVYETRSCAMPDQMYMSPRLAPKRLSEAFSFAPCAVENNVVNSVQKADVGVCEPEMWNNLPVIAAPDGEVLRNRGGHVRDPG